MVDDGEPHRHGRGCAPRGGWDQWNERVNRRFAELFGEGRGGGRSRRMIDGGELRLVLLRLITDEPRHGYELIKAIEDMTGGAYSPSPGMIYPALTMLAEMALIDEQASEGTRKRFAITGDGTAYLARHADQLAMLMARLAALAEHRERTDAEAARRAMRNLGDVVRAKLRRDDVPDTLRHAIVDLIDEVAQKIERLK